MVRSYRYIVAGHAFEICLPEGFDKETYLRPYEPFAAEGQDVEPLFRLEVAVTDSLKALSPGEVLECLNEEAPYFWIFRRNGEECLNFGFSYSKKCPDCILMPSENFKENVVYVPESHAGKVMEFAVSNAMMLLYTFCTNPSDTLMVHASVVRCQGKGYMFLGKSGTGKSTHTGLWLKNFDDAVLLNDDNPVVRVIDDQVFIYGTPWSGKTPCYKNESVPLNGFVRLSQAPYNKISRLNPLPAYAALMPSCSCMRWDRESVDRLHATVEKVVRKVAGWHLECLPDDAAAVLCRDNIELE